MTGSAFFVSSRIQSLTCPTLRRARREDSDVTTVLIALALIAGGFQSRRARREDSDGASVQPPGWYDDVFGTFQSRRARREDSDPWQFSNSHGLCLPWFQSRRARREDSDEAVKVAAANYVIVSISTRRVRPTKKMITIKRNQCVTDQIGMCGKRNQRITWLRFFVTDG